MVANSNLDDGKNTRQNQIDAVNNNYEQILYNIYHGEEEEEKMKSDPFYTAMKVPELPNSPEPTTHNLDIDQG